MKKRYELNCNIAQTLNLIGDRWTLLILNSVRENNDTYNKIQQHLEKIPTNLLSQRLKTLTEDGFLNCNVYSNHPPRYTYTLTEKAKQLEDIIYAIMIWGDKYLDKSYKCVNHKGCGGDIKISYVCEKCNKEVKKSELEFNDHK